MSGMKPYNGFSPEQRDKSYQWLKRQYAAGNVARPSECDACGQREGIIDHHAEDYSEPFGPHIYAYTLCFRCHLMLHSRFSRPEEFRRYASNINGGLQYKPSFTRDYGTWIVPLIYHLDEQPFIDRGCFSDTLDCILEDGEQVRRRQ